MTTRRNFFKKVLATAAVSALPVKAAPVKEEKHPIISPENYPIPGHVYVRGESYCRRVEAIDTTIPVEALDEWFRLRIQQLDLGIKIYTCSVRPENDFPEGTEAQKERYEELTEEMENLYPAFDGWEISSCLKEALREDIDRWFKRRELSLSGEEASIGVSPIEARAWMLYGWQAHWEANYDEDRLAQDQEGW